MSCQLTLLDDVVAPGEGLPESSKSRQGGEKAAEKDRPLTPAQMAKWKQEVVAAQVALAALNKAFVRPVLRGLPLCSVIAMWKEVNSV